MKEPQRPEIVVITGASAGLGRATAQAFARHGARIGLIARGIEGLEGVRREVENLGGKALSLPADVADPHQIEKAAEAVEQQLGPIDIWINNAMTSVFSPVKATTAEEFKRVTDVTYLGYVYGTQAALRRMLPRDRGTIIQVGSALAYRGIPLQAAYCAAKHAIQGFHDSLRSELIHDKSKVRVTMVQMPALNTPQFNWVKSHLPKKARPVPPIFQPEIGAEAIYWAAHHDRKETWVGWSTAKAILADRFLSSWLDRYLAKNAYQGQQLDEPENPLRADNLWGPVDQDQDFGAHGTFDREARQTSTELWFSAHRNWIGLAGVGVAALLTGLISRKNDRK